MHNDDASLYDEFATPISDSAIPSLEKAKIVSPTTRKSIASLWLACQGGNSHISCIEKGSIGLATMVIKYTTDYV